MIAWPDSQEILKIYCILPLILCNDCVLLAWLFTPVMDPEISPDGEGMLAKVLKNKDL